MKIAIFSSHKFEVPYLEKANRAGHELKYFSTNLNLNTAGLAREHDAVSLFVNDDASAPVLEQLHEYGIRYVALRSAGYNHVDLQKAKSLGMKVANVPEYSPYAIAEHTVALMLALNRKIIRANNRIKDLNFSLDGLTGFDMHGKKVGILGMGKIGAIVARILHGFGCEILSFDMKEDPDMVDKYGVKYMDIDSICKQADIITLHLPLIPQTRYIIGKEAMDKMKDGVMLINTSRGALLDTKEVIKALKNGKIGYLGLDVYEEESGLFFEDHSEDDILQDDMIARLMTFKNVLITSHQAFLTDTALQNISDTTFYNIDQWAADQESDNELQVD
ncbi:2-hydroxyacid dehydrogenase [Flavilitoribacter nigricans]|uniref:Hydroxyacid dehydrogenase n=1 Tax=Flavilitoribacter nigricans (strain ATCC 23147 / DSM 23189 / NBRC 102662 / NCIMB 1420 / SS-2) TaxID=1122177 RepID=A0A2D0N946_FLAN2|nr:2-hydroxyacid dehydrogenase [Flavilitoribacter nigricans]PHN04669.1 hydroxyacid dehydrogenase [Flavilitoribacter nigricans DSM 23189 = NBRC 102662]